LFYINEAGQVGIGTTSPSAKLAVDGLMYIGGTGTSTITDNLNVMGALKVGTSSTYIDTDSIAFSVAASITSAGELTLGSASTSKVNIEGTGINLTAQSNRPSNPDEGEFYYDSKAKNVLLYDGQDWKLFNGTGLAGTFDRDRRTDEAVGNYPRSVAIGDLNNDGYADLVIFASPLYIFNVTGIMKTFMDRLLPILKPYMLIDKKDGHISHPDRYPELGEQGFVVFSAAGFPDVDTAEEMARGAWPDVGLGAEHGSGGLDLGGKRQ